MMHSSLFRVVAFLGPLLLASAAAHGVLYRWALAFRWGRERKTRLKFATAALIAWMPLVRAFAWSTKSDFSSLLVGFATIEVVIAVLALIPIAVVQLAGWILWRRRASASISKANDDALMGRRRALEQIGGAVALGSTGALLGWGIVRGRHAFEVDEVVVKIAGLPRFLDGYTIAQVSDMHVGTFVGERELREGLSRVKEFRPDLVVVTGDLIDYDARYGRLLGRMLADLEPRDGVAAIVGNHDYYTGVFAVMAAMRDAGVDVLMNAGRRIRPKDGGGFALLGVDDLWSVQSGGRGPDLDSAIEMVPKDLPRILLSHQPRSVDEWAGQVALQLSGHTHGGQINPGFRPAALFMPYLAGRYEVDGTTLWVNRGFGVSGPPSRVGAPPK